MKGTLMAVGQHYTRAQWDAMAFALYGRYQDFCALVQQLADALAPVPDQTLIDNLGFTSGEVGDLKSGCNVANSLRLLAQGSTDATVLTQARQVSVLVGKFGGA